MKKLLPLALTILFCRPAAEAQNVKASTPSTSILATKSSTIRPAESFIVIHKEKDSPFEIYQDMMQDQMVIRLKNQFDVLRFEIRDEQGRSMNVKGLQDKNEVHADLKDLVNGRYRLIVDRNKEKIFTEFFIKR